MSEEDLEVLITLDDPVEDDEEDTFHHLQAEEYDSPWPGQPAHDEKRHGSPANQTADVHEETLSLDNQKGPKLETRHEAPQNDVVIRNN
ncbi:MAG TPA: hypothetical protein VFD63_25785 [Pyrinomonadaceae bacterium]|jgi:hypothetical protein|nr:hypothetical protein [Pyrinomonadaceae bacterium]